MNTEVRTICLPLNRWIAVAGQMPAIVEKTRREAVGHMVSGGAGITMLGAARQAEALRRELVAQIDEKFEQMGRSELAAQQQMAREELLELGAPDDTEMGGHAQLRQDTERLLMDTTAKIQAIGKSTLDFNLPAWIVDELGLGE